MENSIGIMGKLLEIQSTLKVEKGHYSSFNECYYRSKEDILEAVKPLAHERGCVVICDDSIESVSDGWVYVKACARLIDAETGETVSAFGYAREPESKKKMDSSQVTGSTSSYAGKRALGNLFAIDDTADSDQIGDGSAAQDCPASFIAVCSACGMAYQFESDEQMQRSMCQCGNTHFMAV